MNSDITRDPTPETATEPGASTNAVHAGSSRERPYHSLIDPVVQTATYTFQSSSDLQEFMEAKMWGRQKGRVEYGRYGNPTVRAVENRLAALENAQSAVLFGSGMAALTTVMLTVLSAGSHMVITDDCYRRTRQFSLSFLSRLGIDCTIVPAADYAALEAAIEPGRTRLLVSESPTNPYLRCLDLQRFAKIARKHRVKTLVDATFATPFNVRPLDYGIDLVVHSGTKYLAGHNDVMAGVVLGETGLVESFRAALGMLGAVCDPGSAALLLRGLKTAGLRIDRHNKNGQAVAEFLAGHPKVGQVWYPGLASHPEHALAQRQMRGFGGVVSFRVGSSLAEACELIDAVEIPQIAASLGGTESLIEPVAVMSYSDLSSAERLDIGIHDNLVRLACGIEDSRDLIRDLEQALSQLD